MLRFKQFVEQDAVTRTFDFTKASQANTDTHFPTQQQAAVNKNLEPVIKAIQTLDPFLLSRGSLSISGTVDYMSPEQAAGTDTEPDWLTYLYLTTSKNNMMVATILKPVVQLGQKFMATITPILHNNVAEAANLEMIAKLDLQNFHRVKIAMENIKNELAKKIHLPEFSQAIKAFNPFYQKWASVSDKVKKYLEQDYNQVAHLKWDQHD